MATRTGLPRRPDLPHLPQVSVADENSTMVNTLYLPEIREMLAANNVDEMREFCTALHPARTAEFMEGLAPEEAWQVIQHAEPRLREQIFTYFDHDRQVAIFEQQDPQEVGALIVELAADDRVDLLRDVDPEVVEELLPLLPAEVRRNILRLREYPEGTAGAIMTTEIAQLAETLTVREALEELSRQAEHLETVYYIYVIDETEHLRGLVTTRRLVSAIGRPDTRLSEIMETDLLTVNAFEDREEVARKVAKYDLLAIPVVDHNQRLLGIITHDDIIDVVREEAVEDAQRIAAVEPLEESYMRTGVFTLTWKRGIWLAILFGAGLITAFSLQQYQHRLDQVAWLVVFIPLVISTGGNTGSQSATLIITAMATGDVRLQDWPQVLRREVSMGLLLGSFLASIGFLIALVVAPTLKAAFVVPLTLMAVVLSGAALGSLLPMIFRRLGLDPAMMSNPFVAAISDILGIILYMNIAFRLLQVAG